MALALALAAGWRWRLQHAPPAAAATAAVAAPVPVTVATVTVADVAELSRAVGTVQALHKVDVRSRIDGVLESVAFREGQHVEAGALLARIDDRAIAANVAQARAELVRNEASLASARNDLERYRNLLGRSLVPRQTFDQQAATVRELEAAVVASQAAVHSAEVALTYTHIASPIAGRVGLRRVDPGNLVRATDSAALVTVTQFDPIAVLFSLPQTQWPPLQALLRGPAPVMVSVRDEANGAELARGQLLLGDNEIDTTTGSIRLKATFPNADERLWPGQFVAVTLEIARHGDALTVPLGAVQRGLDQPFVYRLRAGGDEGHVEVVNVRVAYQDEKVAVIADGLSAGDRVVVDGQSRLRDGAAVKLVDTRPADPPR